MNILKNMLTIAFIAVLALNCKNEAKPKVKTVDGISQSETDRTLDPNATYAKAEFTIDGMTCAMGCAKTIEKKLSKMDGVKSSVVDFDKKLAMVEYDQAKVTPALLEETVGKVSDTYKVSDMHTVDAFSTSKKCGKNCDKPCCANKTDAAKKSCGKDCDKPCCAESSTNKDTCTGKKECCTNKSADQKKECSNKESCGNDCCGGKKADKA